MTLLIQATNQAAFDAAFAQTGLATYTTPTELETAQIKVPVHGTVAGKEIRLGLQPFSFTAATIKGLTLPYTVSRDVTYDLLGLSGTASVDFVVSERETYQRSGIRSREERVRFDVNGHYFSVQDDTGKEMVVDPSIRLWGSGVILYNKKAVYDSNGTQVSPANLVPGFSALCHFREAGGQQSFLDLYTVDGAGWTTTQKTYTVTAENTDWGTGYTMDYDQITFTDGAKMNIVTASTLPDELLTNSGSADLKAVKD